MKYLKQKLMASLAMVLVAATMMGTSTYAWFAISTAPEIGSISTLMEASGSLEIALGKTGADNEVAGTTLDDGDIDDQTERDQTWGQSITSVAHTTGLQFPATIDSDTLSVPTYADDGRPTSTMAAATMPDTYADGVGTATAKITVNSVETEYVVANSTLVWLRSNVNVADLVASWDQTNFAVKGATDSTITKDDIGVAVVINGSAIALVEEDNTLTGLDLDANVATKVEILVYLEGTGVANADMAEELTIEIGAITFSSSTVDGVGDS